MPALHVVRCLRHAVRRACRRHRHRDEIGPTFERLSQLWRAKHLEYTWIHAQTGRPIDFWTLTERSLDYAIAAPVGAQRRA